MEKKITTLLRWIWITSKGFRGNILLCTLLSMLKVFLGWCFIAISKTAVDMATSAQTESLYMYLIALPAIILTEIGITVLVNWFQEMRSVKMNNTLKQTIFTHLIKSEWQGMEQHHTGDIMSRMESDVSQLVTFVTATIPNFFVVLFQLVGSFFFLWYLDPTLAWVILIISPIFLLVAKVYTGKMRKITKQIRNDESDLQSIIQESLQYRIVIKTLEQHHETESRSLAAMHTLLGHVSTRTKISIFSRTFISLGFAVGYVVTFSWGILQIAHGIISYGTLTAFLQLSARVQDPIVTLSSMLPTFIKSLTAVERIGELLELPIEEFEEKQPMPGSLGLRLHDISYIYPLSTSQRKILDHFSCDIHPGAKVAILGETGVGKTTLIRLLLSLLRPTEGLIELYNDRGDKAMLDAGYRNCFSYVPQGNTLLSGTIRSNLLMGKSQATDAELQEALHQAAADFVMALPQQLDTPCGERGSGLSEGQAQRIAIARALLKGSSILILDEATSALDPETEQTVLNRLTETGSAKTLIMITHRPASAERCDMTIHLSRN